MSGQVNLRTRISAALPPGFRRVASGVEDAVASRLYVPAHLRFWLRDAALSGASVAPRSVCERALVDWLKRAQDAADGGGVAAYYDFNDGWSAGYPETTGYIIVTALQAAARLDDFDLKERARRMADWELGIQLPEGAWQGGVVSAPRIPSVFNTGQIVQGMVAAASAFGNQSYLDAAAKAGRWLGLQQDTDGAWRRYTYNDFPNAYSTRVAWPLISLADAAGEPEFRRTAVRYLEWAARCQDESGWFSNCTLEPGTDALTHTLAYTIEGFIEAGVLLRDERWITIGRRAADVLLRRHELRGRLAGAYASGWRGDFSYNCVTGSAQMGRIWGRLFSLTGDARYLNAALKINDYVSGLVDLASVHEGLRGGLKGSDPVWGPYMRFRMPSWAAKFALDSFFHEADGLARLEENNR